MTETRLNKHLRKRPSEPDTQIRRKPVLFSDSKARYLEEVSEYENVASTIIWKTYRGQESDFIIGELKSQIHSLIQEHGNLQLIVWAGTCDLTDKISKFIYIKPDIETAQRKLVRNLLQLEEYILENQYTRLTILEIPYISTSTWNESRNHPGPLKFKGDDTKLKQTIDVVNSVIRCINTRTGGRSPKFNLDIERPNKNKDQPTKIRVNWNLFTDVVHPGRTLARVWLRNICQEVVNQCF